MTIRCLSVGAVTRDLYGDREEIGGSAYYAARVFAGLGASASLATNAPPSVAELPSLAGVELLYGGNAPSPVFVNEYGPGAVRRQWVKAVAADVEPGGLDCGALAADVVFLCPVLGEVPLARWLPAVRAPLVGLGIQGFVRAAEPVRSGTARRRVVPAAFDPAPDLLSRVDAVFLSEEDVALSSPSMIDSLRASVRLVFLTRGEAGARVFFEGGFADLGVFQTSAVDPTGAGDSFAAACLLALAEGADPPDAARLGAAAASIVVEGVGGANLHRIGEARERAKSVQSC